MRKSSTLASLPKTRFSYLLTRLRRRIWFRAALISLGAIALAGLAAFSSAFVTFETDTDIGQDAVGTILEIIASSMLAVTTFSLTAMVTAYGAATQLATPRATQLLIGDTTSQNALSTFLGAFVFSVVGIIGLQTNMYGETGRIVLFVGTVLLILVVVVTLLRWIAHLMTFGRMSDVMDRVEDAATRSMKAFAEQPYRGARPAIAVPAGARVLCGERTGYVDHVDMQALKAVSAEHGVAIHVAVCPGALVHPGRPLMHVDGALDEERERALRAAFSIERHRSFDHDPRLGIIALAEIGSRALAPATNDPGTAIEVMNAMLRVLLVLPPDEETGEGPRDEGDTIDRHSRVYATRPRAEDFLEDAFAPMLREGGKEGEVAIRLTKTLAALRDQVPHVGGRARELAEGLARSVRSGETSPIEQARFDRCHEPLWAQRP